MLENFEPKLVFEYFEKICSMPHGSSNTQIISDYLVDEAKQLNLPYRQDEKGNVIIWKAASAGYENAEPVILQGHMDMVCEKEEECPIDMSKEGLELCLEGTTISAKGTTLGGDDGIAVAYCLAILADETLQHPPIECVFTVDEEIGMLGATALDCSDLKGKILLNIDSEEEGEFLVSCAGGVSVTIDIPVEYEEISGDVYELKIDGLQGGHSGVEIDKGLGNACILLGNVANKLGVPMGISCIEGGLKDNAIPRKATLNFVTKVAKENWTSSFEKTTKSILEEYKTVEKEMQISIEKVAAKVDKFMTEESAKRVLGVLADLPNGVQKMSEEIEDLVQTSLNLGIMKYDDEKVSFTISARSSVEAEKRELVETLVAIAKRYGGEATIEGDYPAWEYKEDSKIREVMCQVYEKQYGRKPLIKALHAGLECGIFAGKISGLDCVSFGPDIKEIHTTRETMDADSVTRTWELIVRTLEELR